MSRFMSTAALLFCVLSWGASYVAIKMGLDSFSPSQVASYRFFVAGLISACLLMRRGRPLPNRKQGLQILGVAFFGIFNYHIAITYFTTLHEPNLVSLFSNTAPIFMLLFSYFFLRESLQNIRWTGFILAFLGIAIICIQPDIQFGWHQLGLFTIPLSGALFFVIQKPLLKTLSSTLVMDWSIVAGSFMLLLWDFSFFDQLLAASAKSHLSIIFLGVFPTIIAFQLWSYLLSKSELNQLSSPIYLVPPSTILFSYLFLDQSPTITIIIGGLLTIIGVGLSRK